MTTPDERIELTALGICITCRQRDGHADWCPNEHVGFADGTELCGRCRHGLDPGEAYLSPSTEDWGPFTFAENILCLPCGVSPDPPPSTTREA